MRECGIDTTMSEDGQEQFHTNPPRGLTNGDAPVGRAVTPVVDGFVVSRVAAELVSIALVRDDLRDMLAHLCRASVELLDVAAAAVVLHEAGDQGRLAAASDEAAFHVAAEHLDTLRAGGDPSPVGETGLTLSKVPMHANGEAIGSLDLYHEMVEPMASHQADIARTLARVAAELVWRVRAHEHDRTLVDQLQHALASRIAIEQAKGSLSVQQGITIDEAFERLRRHARNNNMKLRAVCRQLIDGELDL